MTVQQARKLNTVKIVSFDWLEDSLMKQTAKSTGGYLMSPRTKAAAEIKAKKKVVRKKNIAKGSTCLLLPIARQNDTQ